MKFNELAPLRQLVCLAVLSDMRELGSDSLQYHVDTLHEAIENNLDSVYLYGPEFEMALKQVDQTKIDFKHFSDFDSLYKSVQLLFKNHDLILIKGSRYYALERLMEEA